MRRDFEKYGTGSYTASRLMKQDKNTIPVLLTWLERNVSENEVIEISYWTGTSYHITVKDTRKGWNDSVEAMRCGFAVNIEDDKVLWSHTIRHTGEHGHVFVRSNKWKSLMKKYFGVEIYYTKISRYRTINLSKGN